VTTVRRVEVEKQGEKGEGSKVVIFRKRQNKEASKKKREMRLESRLVRVQVDRPENEYKKHEGGFVY